MTQEETIFMTKYGIKEMEFYCDNDNMYKARFTYKNFETFTFTSSSAKVMEHVKRFYAHTEKYLDNKGNKGLVASHFHRMARSWYRATHLSKIFRGEIVKNVNSFGIFKHYC